MKREITEALHRWLGFADPMLAEAVDSMARKSRDVADLERRLRQDLSLESNASTRKLAEELHALVQPEAAVRPVPTAGGSPLADLDFLVESGRDSVRSKRDKSVADLRRSSRYDYLRKREQQKLEELEADVRDEEYLFRDVKLTTRERAAHARKKRLLEVVQARQAAETAAADVYHLPDSGFSHDGHALSRAEREALALHTAQRPSTDEPAAWESQQLSAALSSTTTNRKKPRPEESSSSSQPFVFSGGVEFEWGESQEGIRNSTTHPQRIDPLSTPHAPETPPVRAYERLQEERVRLPVYEYREAFIEAVKQHPVVIVVGETGSGKTTQLPQYLFEAGLATESGQKIGCTQPRRVAAMSVAKRVADEMGCRLGEEVGYSIRFEDCTSARTCLHYMTDGMLLREFLAQPDLASYAALMIDEAHERTVHTDVLLALAKDVVRYRPSFRLLIASATLDAAKFSKYFDDAPIFSIPGRRHPVDVYYTAAPEADYVDAAVVTAMQIHLTQPAGDVLVFLTGQEEVESAREVLEQRMQRLGARVPEMRVCPVYSALPADQQARIFEPAPAHARKVVLATNIAETSLTIDGVVYVVDAGFCKQTSYDAKAGVESLTVVPISKASAGQRAGRAGRTQPGKCFRLFTRWSYEHELEDCTPPELQRVNLTAVVLLLKSLGIHDLAHFDFLDPPPADALLRALEQLFALGALGNDGELTALGRRMAALPIDPPMARALLAASEPALGCTEEMLTLAAMLSVGQAVFYRPRDLAKAAMAAHERLADPSGDHRTLLNVYQRWQEAGYESQWALEHFVQLRSLKRARDVREQLRRLLASQLGGPATAVEGGADPRNLLKAVLAGYFQHVAQLNRAGVYVCNRGPRSVHIHPSSSLVAKPPRCLLYHELVLTSKDYMRVVSEIDPRWLVEVVPHVFQFSSTLSS